MRPLKLTMSAFGPYPEETVIDLEQLGKTGIYIITGDTGAGKTTIFDAICFALYGSASGGNRDVNMFRSKYADPKTPTFVELVFEYKGKKYKVVRNPKYVRQKLVGTGITTEDPKAELFDENGKIIANKGKVTDEITNIMGIDKNQFTQIAMIAQGEFLDLILADTGSRQAIFSKIFSTDNYKSLQYKLKNNANEVKDQCKVLKNSVNQYVQGIECPQNSIYFEDIEKAKVQNLFVEDLIEILERIIIVDEDEVKTSSIITENLDSQLEKINLQLGKAEEIQKAENSLAIAKGNLREKLPSHQLMGQELKKQENLQAQRDMLFEQISHEKKDLGSYDLLDEVSKNLGSSNTQLNSLIQKESKLETIFQNNNKIIIENKKELISLKDVKLHEQALIQNKKESDKRLEDLNIYGTEIQNYIATYNSLTEANNSYDKCFENWNAAKTKYDNAYIAYLNEQAGILALNLKFQERCPVCGSLEHPNPAKLTDKAPTKVELDKLKKNSENQQKALTTQSEIVAKLKGQYESEKKNIIEKAKILLDVEESTQIKKVFVVNLKNVKIQNEDLATDITNVKTKVERFDLLEKTIVSRENQLVELQKNLQNVKDEKIKTESQIKSLNTQITQIKAGLKFENRAKANENISNLEKTLDKMKKDFQTAQDNFTASDSQMTKLLSQIETLKTQLENKTEVDVELLQGQKSELVNQKQDISTKITKISSRLKGNIYAIENITKQKDKLSQLEKKESWLSSLSDTANGNISGKEKIMLETYILMTYFDRVIARANLRFLSMSQGQYELVRQKESSNNRSQTGLELSIIDHYNGSERSVKTLSGGEAFKASLSLALGLSDEIQSNAGGIELNTMFVDEGFGNLDEESLEQAIKTLNNLANNDRLIGIISHVAVLEKRIDKKILITKNKEKGSSAEIIV